MKGGSSMSKARKIMAWLLTGIMALGMCTTVSAAGFSITRQPEDAASAEGSTVVFEVAAEPSDNVTYQWQQGVLQKTEEDTEPVCSWTDIPGADKARYEHKVTAADLSGIGYRCKVSLDGETVYSETVVIREPGILPVLVSKDSTSITVQAVRGQEYRIDQKAWQESGRFEGLSPDTEYVIETRAAGEGEDTPVSEPLTVRTMKAGAGAPEAPKLKSAGVDEIEVVAAEGLEYAICEGEAASDQQWNWQTVPVFGGLKAGTEYSIVARTAGTEDQMPGAISEALSASTQKHEAPALSRPELVSGSDTRIEVKAVSGQLYAIYKGSTIPEDLTWQSGGVFEKLTPNTEYRIVTKTPETEDYKESIVSEALVVTTRKTPTAAPEAPKLKSRSQTVLEVEKRNGQEYSIDGGKTWQDGGRFENLKAETAYEIITRIKETQTSAASEAGQPLKVSTLRNPIETGTSANKITGIKNGQIIKVNKNITFTAVGGGMEIKDPIDGDVRYVPVRWQGLSEGTWKKAPYTATVKAAKSGTYTLKVTFDRQTYKNGKWVSDGKDDIKSVQLKATATGKPAVKTGDETQSIQYLLLLAAAAGAAGIAGAVVRKRRKA